MLEKQLVRSIVENSKDVSVKDSVIVSQTIIINILKSLSEDQKIELLQKYGFAYPSSTNVESSEIYKELRSILGHTQTNLAKLCDVNQCDISYVENDNLVRISGEQVRLRKIINNLKDECISFLRSKKAA
jgi:DNA-binding XRE family transcriptional regulator